MKVLILKPSSLGDVVQALPVARLLRRAHPEAEIHWWLNRELTPLLDGDPDIARVIPFDRKRLGQLSGFPRLVSHLQSIRAERYDLVVDLQALARSAFVSWYAGGGFTIGLEDRREGAPAFYDQAIPRAGYATHAVDWYLDVLRALGIRVDRDFEWLPARPEVFRLLRCRIPSLESDCIAVQPGARWDTKRWPIDHFRQLIAQLRARLPRTQILILGGGDDRPLGAALSAAGTEGVLDLTGQLDLQELVEVMRRVRVLVTNDTGPMHIAAALGRPVVGLFGPTEPRRTGPYGSQHRILRHELPCSPCLKSRCRWRDPLACLVGILPRQVADAVVALLDGTSA
jgi:heptosyltransferase I